MHMNLEEKKSRLLPALLVLLMSIISGALALVLWFIMRDTILTILIYNNVNAWKIPAFDNFSFLFLGIAWLIFILLVHHLFNKGIKNDTLLYKFFLVNGVQLLLFFFCNFIMVLLDQSKEINLLIIGELVIGCMLIIASLFIKRKKKQNGSVKL